MAEHIVLTTHVQQLLREALDLAAAVNRRTSGEQVQTRLMDHPPTVDQALERIANLAQRVAAEVHDEWLKCDGWR